MNIAVPFIKERIVIIFYFDVFRESGSLNKNKKVLRKRLSSLRYVTDRYKFKIKQKRVKKF